MFLSKSGKNRLYPFYCKYLKQKKTSTVNKMFIAIFKSYSYIELSE